MYESVERVPKSNLLSNAPRKSSAPHKNHRPVRVGAFNFLPNSIGNMVVYFRHYLYSKFNFRDGAEMEFNYFSSQPKNLVRD